MFGAVMMMKEKKENHGRSPTQLRKHEKKSTGLSFGNVQPRYNLDLPARPDALTYSGGVARSMDIGQGHLANESSAGQRVAIIQRMRNNVIQRCGQSGNGNAQQNPNKKQTGSYTIVFADGKKYHGKGPKSRMEQSAREKSTIYNNPVMSTDWKPAKDNKSAFIDEYRRLEADGGYTNPNNYNKRQSPGKKYLENDKK